MVPIIEELRPPPDSIEACARLLGLPYLLFLDSVSDDRHLGRYSFLAADPSHVVRSKGAVTEILTPSGAGEWRASPAQMPGDALGVIRALLPKQDTAAVPGLPPFQGGAAGYIGYDWGAVLERLPSPRYDDLAVPDVMLALYDWVIAWDHAAGQAWIISTGIPETGAAGELRAAARLEMVKSLVKRSGDRGTVGPWAAAPGAPSGPRSRGPAVPPTYPLGPDHRGIRSTFTHDQYLGAVSRVREYILAGDIFQANLSQRFQTRLAQPPFDFYRRLRGLNPAPFAAYLDFDGVVVASASPERFLQLDPRTRMVETRPIKGTRPRGTGPMHDAALGRALAESEKDQAENVMIVDLLRNDLSRVCRPGTVRVPELFALEHHPTVHHLVSTVVGELEPGRDATDLLRATFPGGSITGAPKVRAMEIIAEMEPTRRGVYCGAIGYLSLTGALDTSIVIRTCLALGDEVYFQAGGGIVADSDPEQEYQETLDKARGLMAALGAGSR